MALTLNQSARYRCEVYAPESAVEDVSDVDVLLVEASLDENVVKGITTYARRLNQQLAVLLIVPSRMIGRMLEFAQFDAQGCIDEQCKVTELQAAVEKVAAGETYCSSQVAETLFRQAGHSPGELSAVSRGVKLTSREREILELIAWEKLGNKQIAYRLSISLYTVKNHVHNLIEKLGVADRHEAVQRANRLMLLGDR